MREIGIDAGKSAYTTHQVRCRRNWIGAFAPRQKSAEFKRQPVLAAFPFRWANRIPLPSPATCFHGAYFAGAGSPPRVCGATLVCMRPPLREGLSSTRVRGNLLNDPLRLATWPLLPACAGQPSGCRAYFAGAGSPLIKGRGFHRLKLTLPSCRQTTLGAASFCRLARAGRPLPGVPSYRTRMYKAAPPRAHSRHLSTGQQSSTPLQCDRCV